MSNRNNTSEEDYLDSLLRSITGAADEQSDSDSLDDSLLEEEINFGNEDNIGASDEEFLSDFEKVFFGDSDEELLGGIMDEVDSVLIDEARTPLIISGGSLHTKSQYMDAQKFVSRLKEDVDFTIDEKTKTISLTD